MAVSVVYVTAACYYSYSIKHTAVAGACKLVYFCSHEIQFLNFHETNISNKRKLFNRANYSGVTMLLLMYIRNLLCTC